MFSDPTGTSRHLPALARVATLVAMGDLVTKAAAARYVGGEPTIFSSWLRFAVVHNDRAAFGLSLGAYTWQLNLAITMSAIVFVIIVSRDLARVDPLAPRALGLIAGAALGNFLSLVSAPHGVVDFISLRAGDSGIVLNVADVAAYVGLAMILRTGFRIVAEMRSSVRAEQRQDAERPLSPVLPLSLVDREIPRPVVRDGVETGNGAMVEPTRPLGVSRVSLSRSTEEVRVLQLKPRADSTGEQVSHDSV